MDYLCWTTLFYCLTYGQLFLLLSWWFWRILWDASAKIPGPRIMPIIDDISLLRITSAPFSYLLGLSQRYGSTLRVWFGRNVFVVITDADVAEKIHSQRSVRNRPRLLTLEFKRIILEGMVMSEDEKWRKARKTVVSTLHKSSMNQFIEVFVKNSDILINRLLADSKGAAIDIHRYFTQFAMDVFFETMLGMEVNSQINNDWQSFKDLRSLFSINAERKKKPWLLIDSVFKMTSLGKDYQRAWRSIDGKLRDVVRARQKAIESKLKLDEDVSKECAKCIDLLLANYSKSEEEVKAECCNLFAAGINTVGSTCSYVLVFLAENPEVQHKLMQEQLEIFGENNFRRPVSAEDLPQMVYLDQVIKETLRHCPPIPFTLRWLDQDLDIGGGMRIPANTNVVICTYLMHRNAKYFPDPSKFNPDNFDPKVVLKRHPYSYAPFGGGRRMCICQNMATLEMKTVLSTVLRSLVVEGTVNSATDLQRHFLLGIDLTSSLQILVKLLPRD